MLAELFILYLRQNSLTRLRLPLAAVFVSLCLSGCVSLGHKPVAENVVQCRERCQAGLEAARRGCGDEAHELFAGAVKTCPVDQRARELYADALWEVGQRIDAIKHMQEAVRLSGGQPDLLVRLGQMHLALGQNEQAARRASQAISASPQLACAWALEGDVQRRRGKHDEALGSYHRALVYRPEYPEVQFAVAEIYTEQGRHRRALGTLTALAQQYPHNRHPQRLHVLRGETYKSLGQINAAIAQFSLAVKASPPSAELLYGLAHTLAQSGQHAAARLTAEQALTLQPTHAQSRELIIQLGAIPANRSQAAWR